MRTDLELWLIVKENFEEYFERGLCLTISKMHEMFIITKNEFGRDEKTFKDKDVCEE